jgi:energy-coupling factor transporter ATP-binding protein EcfA2
MTQALIELSDLGFSWPGHPPLLDIPAFRLEAGETLFLKGPSGSGKTTLLGLLGGVQKPDRGSIRLLGQELTVSVDMMVRPTRGNEYLANSPVEKQRLRIPAGDSMMIIAKNPLPIDRRAVEQNGPGKLSLDHQHRLILMTPGRRPWPKSNGQIAKDLGVPPLAK